MDKNNFLNISKYLLLSALLLLVLLIQFLYGLLPLLIFWPLAGVLFFKFAPNYFEGIYVLLKQVVVYIQSETWQSYSAIDFIINEWSSRESNYEWQVKVSAWATDPQSLLGLHKILEFINGGLLFSFLGFYIFMLSWTFVVLGYQLPKGYHIKFKKDYMLPTIEYIKETRKELFPGRHVSFTPSIDAMRDLAGFWKAFDISGLFTLPLVDADATQNTLKVTSIAFELDPYGVARVQLNGENSTGAWSIDEKENIVLVKFGQSYLKLKRIKEDRMRTLPEDRSATFERE